MNILLKSSIVAACALATSIASAFPFTHTWQQTDSQMANRLFRDGAPSEYGIPKAFPGTVGGPVFFVTFTITNSFSTVSRLDVTTTNNNPAVFHSFTSAYLTSFSSSDLSLNYAGDEGTSPNATPSSFSIEIPAMTDVVLMVSSLNTSSNLGQSFTIDATLAPVPEPASMIALTGGIMAMVARRRRRKA